jgi:hypothetical protein
MDAIKTYIYMRNQQCINPIDACVDAAEHHGVKPNVLAAELIKQNIDAMRLSVVWGQGESLEDGDYTLTEGAGWFSVKGFSIRIMSTDEGVVVDVYEDGKEMGSPVSSTYAFDSEVQA